MRRTPRLIKLKYRTLKYCLDVYNLFTEDIWMALLCAADTGVYGLTGEAVAPLVSGGAPDVLEVAKLTPNFDGSASEVAPGAVGTPSSSVLPPLGTVDSIAVKF